MQSKPLIPLILDRIRRAGPLTVAEYVELALYHPEHGYYMTAPRRSGGGGDFYTSVDTGPLFGEAIAVQLEEMRDVLGSRGRAQPFELVDAGAGDGRLARDILDRAARDHPALYDSVRVTLVERSAAARQRHALLLRSHPEKYAASLSDLPAHITGAIVANELLDALPVHVAVGSDAGPREIYIGERRGELMEVEGPLSPAAADYVEREQITIRPGARVELGAAAVEWMQRAAASLDAGFLLAVDYGLTAAELYSEARAGGTMTTYWRHTSGSATWLAAPGSADITAHVNLTAVTRAAERAGLVLLGAADQTYFLLSLGLLERIPSGCDPAAVSARLSAKTLMMPGGLGSTMKVLAFSKGAGRPPLRGFTSARLT